MFRTKEVFTRMTRWSMQNQIKYKLSQIYTVLSCISLGTSVVAAILWANGFSGADVCTSAVCSIQIKFLGLPWIAYGAVFYMIIAMLFTFSVKYIEIIRTGLLMVGVLLHTILLSIQYSIVSEICKVCLGFALMTSFLCISNFVLVYVRIYKSE